MKREFDKEKKLYTLSILVRDIPGVLSQVARLFSPSVSYTHLTLPTICSV